MTTCDDKHVLNFVYQTFPSVKVCTNACYVLVMYVYLLHVLISVTFTIASRVTEALGVSVGGVEFLELR